MHDEVEAVDDDVELDKAEEAERDDVTPSAAFGTIAEREDELEENEGKVEVFDDGVDDGGGGVTEGEGALVVCDGGARAHEVDDDGCCEPIGSCGWY